MKQTVLLAGMFAMALTTPALAEVQFNGSIVFTSVSGGCVNFKAGWRGTSKFHPRIAGNQNFTQISVVFDYSASDYSQGGIDFTSTFQNVNTTGIGWGPYGGWPAQVRVTKMSPSISNITASTAFVTIAGQIKNPEDDPGGASCIASFEAAYVPNL